MPRGGLMMRWVLVYNAIPELMVAVEANARTQVMAHAKKIAADARSRAPVETGYLRSSIQPSSLTAGKEALVLVGAEYGRFVEFGTYKMQAQPFLMPAVEADKAAFFADVGKGMIKL